VTVLGTGLALILVAWFACTERVDWLDQLSYYVIFLGAAMTGACLLWFALRNAVRREAFMREQVAAHRQPGEPAVRSRVMMVR
jgi:hypothetical protein